MYVGLTIELTRTLADGTTYVQTRKITDYHGSRVAIVDVPWDTGYIPGFGLETGETDTFTLFTGIDERASTNPAMQLLDYLTSERYGKGLKESDVDLPTFKSAAADCDQQSTVTVVANGSVTVPNGAQIPLWYCWECLWIFSRYSRELCATYCRRKPIHRDNFYKCNRKASQKMEQIYYLGSG